MVSVSLNLNAYSELEDMGFRGKQLKDLGAIIKSQDDLDEFEVFVLENDHYSSLEVVSKFRKLMIENNLMDKPTFVMEYLYNSDNIEGKRKVLEDLLKTHIDTRWVEELDNEVHKGSATIGNLYEAFLLEPTTHIRRLILQANIN